MHSETDFMRVICAEPDNMTPRLLFADWLEENGQQGRSEFIRCQIELAEIGGPRKKMEGSTATHMGDGYFKVYENTDFQVGDRIDCELGLIRRKEGTDYRNIFSKKLPGLLVTKRGNDGDTCSEWLLLKKDEHSTPFPKKRYEQLKKRERELYLSGNWSQNAMSCYCRGMMEFLTTANGVSCWLQSGPLLVQQCPLQKVNLGIEPYLLGAAWMLAISQAWDDERSTIPVQFIPYMTGQSLSVDKRWIYATREVAIKDVNRAAVLWARDEARKVTV